MSERLADVAAQIESARQLESVVTAMRGIAAARVQQSRALLAGIEAYADVVSEAIGHALSLVPADGEAEGGRGRKRGLIVFAAEHGFVGAFSDHVLASIGDDVMGALVLMVGTRGALLARERGVAVGWVAPMAANVDGVTTLANRVADALYARVAAGAVDDVDLVFPRPGESGGIEIDRHRLLPVDLSRFPAMVRALPPLTTLPPPLLVERLAEEYVYAQLCQAALHAFEAENEARMKVMTAARNNIEDKLADLSRRRRLLRQEEITAEIVELTAGAAALREGAG